MRIWCAVEALAPVGTVAAAILVIPLQWRDEGGAGSCEGSCGIWVRAGAT